MVCVHTIDSCEIMASVECIVYRDIDSDGAVEFIYQSMTLKSALTDIQVLLCTECLQLLFCGQVSCDVVNESVSLSMYAHYCLRPRIA